MRCLHWGNDLSVRLLHFIRLLNTETREESLLQTSLCSHCSEHACYPGLNIRYNPDGQLNFKATRFPTRPGAVRQELFLKKAFTPWERTWFCFKTSDMLTVVLCWGWPQTALLSVSHRSTDNGNSGLEFCIVSWPSPKLPLLDSPQKVGRLMGFWWMGVLWSKYDGICSAAFKLEVNCQPTLPFFGSVHMRTSFWTLNFGLQKLRGMSPSCIFMKFVSHCLAHSPSKASR